jgi:nitrate reductase (cytochrome)
VYDFSGMTRERLKASHGLLWPMPNENHPGTRRATSWRRSVRANADHPTRMKFYGRPDGKAVVWAAPVESAEEVVSDGVPVLADHRAEHRALAHRHHDASTSRS